MRLRTKLPPGSSFDKYLSLAFFRNFCFFFFSYIAYWPIRRVNKPNLEGPYLWASSHSNFFCDVVVAAYEGPCPPRFLAKSTLFIFPIRGVLAYFGGLPLVRAGDQVNSDGSNRSMQNRQSFKAAIKALAEGWGIAIYPEGVCYERPGLILPLKAGVAKLAFAAEEANDFNLGLKIIPVGLEYGSATRLASGLTIRYGTPILVKDFETEYLRDSDLAAELLLSKLTEEMISIFPHFKDEHQQRLGRKLVISALLLCKYDAAKLFAKRENESNFWKQLESEFAEFEESSKAAGIPLPAWGFRRKWNTFTLRQRITRGLFLVLGAPLMIIELVNDAFPEYILNSAVEYLAVDETEIMSLRFLLGIILVPLCFAVQFFVLRKFALIPESNGFFIIYFFASAALWYAMVHWRRQLKVWASLFFFWKSAEVDRLDAERIYGNLLNSLREAE